MIETIKHRYLQSDSLIWFKSFPLQCAAFPGCALIYCKVSSVKFVEKECVNKPLSKNELRRACAKSSIVADAYFYWETKRSSPLYEAFPNNSWTIKMWNAVRVKKKKIFIVVLKKDLKDINDVLVQLNTTNLCVLSSSFTNVFFRACLLVHLIPRSHKDSLKLY